MADEAGQIVKGETIARGPRSPNFPGISLQESLGKARVLYDRDKRNPVRVRTILGHLGFSDKLSGSSARVISALRQFGLLDEQDNHYRISEAAFRVFTLSEGAPERTEALQACAKRPAVYRELLTRYPDGLPSDAALKDALILRKFNPASVDTFIRVFKATLSFAKLVHGEYNEAKDEREQRPPVVVGDYVQWVSQEEEQFEVPRKVLGLSEDSAFAFVEGTQTGVPMSELTKEQAPAGAPNTATRTPPPSPHFAAQPIERKPIGGREVFGWGGGAEAVLEWPASIDSDGVEDLEAWLKLVITKLKRLKPAQPK